MPYPSLSSGCNYATFTPVETDPDLLPGNGKLYSKYVDVEGDFQVQLFYKDSADVIHQITPPAPAPPSSGEIFDYVLDPTGVASGNVYTDFASLYAEASTKQGAHRVFCKAIGGGGVSIDAEYTLEGSWQFVGIGGDQSQGRRRLDFLNDGQLYLAAANVRFENLQITAGQATGRYAIILGELPSDQDCVLVFDKCLIGYSHDTGLITRDSSGSNFQSRVYFNECLDYGGGPGFCLAELDYTSVYLRFTNIENAANFFGPGAATQAATTAVYVDQCALPAFPAGASGTGESPFNNGLDSADYYFTRITRAQSAYVEFSADLEDVELYALGLVDILSLRATAPDLEVRTIQFNSSANMFAFDVINSSAESFIIRHAFDGGASDIWCPNGQDLTLNEFDGVRFVRDTTNNVWRALAYSADQSYDLVYNADAPDSVGNLFNDFSALVAVGSQLQGMRRVSIISNLDIASNVVCNGGWTFEGVGGNGGFYGIRDVAMNADMLIEGSSAVFRNLIITGHLGGIRTDGTTGTCQLDFYKCTLNGNTAPACQPVAGQCGIVLNLCSVLGSAGVGAFADMDGTVVVIDTNLGGAAFVDSVSLNLVFNSGSVEPSNVNNQIGDWTDFETNAFVTGNMGWSQQWDLTGDPPNITLAGVEVLRTLWLTTPVATPQTLASITAPLNGRANFDVINSGPDTVTLLHLDGTGTLGGLFFCPGAVSLVLQAGEGCRMAYDALQGQWCVLG